MAKTRLGKRERAERKAQYALVKQAKARVIADNLANLKALEADTRLLGFRQSNLDRWLSGSHSFHGASNMSRPNMFGADGTKYGAK